MDTTIVQANAHLYNVIDKILDGIPLRDAVREAGLSVPAFGRRLRADKALALAYARAAEMRADVMADEIIHIADSDTDPAKARNQIQARQWLASKLCPKTYGDRIDLNVTQTIDIGSTLAEARNRLLPMRDQQTIIDGESRVIADVAAPCVADNVSVPTVPPDAEPDIFS